MKTSCYTTTFYGLQNGS
jgi:hypothetical protein